MSQATTPPISYLKGDATAPRADGNKIIVHVCNDAGGWGAGFVLALSRRWPEPEQEYRRWHREGEAGGFRLGAARLVQVEPDLWVANMVAQHGMIDYGALEACLRQVAEEARRLGASVHMPRIGTGLAGGRWEEVEPIILRTLCDQGIPVTVYDL